MRQWHRVNPWSSAIVVALGMLGAASTAGQGWQVAGPDGQVVQRWVTNEPACPAVHWSSGRQEAMQLRIGPGQPAGPVAFDDRVCEIAWPRTESGALIAGKAIATPYRSYRRIALIGDTGCRRKAADQAYQNCDSPTQWPFATVAQAVRANEPDLVIHVGDITYRESPCPDGTNCQNPAWGYGSDVWATDLFAPAGTLLETTPWVFVRGNHESCERAGQGWFRYIDPRPYVSGQSCDSAQHPQAGNFTLPYRVPLGATTQLVVLDSAASGNKPQPGDTTPELGYLAQLELARGLMAKARHTWVSSHHPFYAMAPSPRGEKLQAGYSKVLAQAIDAFNPATLRTAGVIGFVHGHIHAFEVLDFQERLPVSLIVGNSGSQMEGQPPRNVPPGFAVRTDAHIDRYASQPGFGFALFEFTSDHTNEVTLTEFDVNGTPLLRCKTDEGRSLCGALAH